MGIPVSMRATWVGRESSHGRKELFNLPPLVLKARAPNDGSAFCIGFSRLEVPEQTLGGIPLGLGMVMKINFFEFSCMYGKNTVLQVMYVTACVHVFAFPMIGTIYSWQDGGL